MSKNIAILALESSGDKLGSYLMADLKNYNPQINFCGIGGVKMKAEGLKAFYSVEDFSVIGIIEILKNLKKFLTIKKDIYKKILLEQPDLVIGIDSYSFNLPLERKFKKKGIKVIHYVSPQVWGWRPWRAKSFHKSLDLLLLLYPFEKKFYQNYNVAYKYVGYPFVELTEKNYFKLNPHKITVAILPGSRKVEIKYLLPTFLAVAQKLTEKYAIQFIIPLANDLVKNLFYEIYNKLNFKLDITVVDGRSQEAMLSSQVVLCASGTATLEAMFLGRPAVVCYRGDFIMKALVKALVMVKYCAMPNLLADQEIFPEFLQENVTCDKICAALEKFMTDQAYYNSVINKIEALNLAVKNSGECTAAQAVIAFMEV